MKTAIVGWGHTRFGRLDEHDLESLIVSVAREAVDHAGLGWHDIDAITLGNLNAGLVKESFCSSLALQADPALRFVPATRLENACASGSAALHHGQTLIESGRARRVLVIIAAPLRKTDCSLVSDGAAAVVLTDIDSARSHRRAVGIRAAVQVNDFLPMSRRDAVRFEGPARAFALAYAQAGIGVDDLDFAEVHDCFTIAELLSYEAMGLAPTGQGARVIDDGSVLPGGRLPVNLSGGLKSKGHPIGATGVSMHVMAAKQLTGTAGDLQRPGATLGAVFNMGGSAVASCVSVPEALQA